ncbi:MAG TPA: exosortase [Pyrinomonadaceae bacterium]|jgi:exosortase
MSALSLRNLWKPLTLAAVLAFVYSSMLAKLGYDWWTDENYSHGLLIPFIIGYILWAERDRLGRAAGRPALAWGGLMVVLAMLALWAGTAGAELYVQRLSLVLMLAGIAIYFWGWPLLRLLLVPLGLLLLAIPIPAILFNKIAFPLQLFASRCAVWAMRLFDIPVLRQGNVIELMPLGARHTKKLEVVEACSGIRSLMTLVTLAVVFAYFTRPRGDDPEGTGKRGGGFLERFKRFGFWRAVIIVGSAVPIAILTNALRVSGTGVLAHYYGTEVADGFFHSFSGWVVYILAFLLLFAVGWLVDRFGRRGGRGGGSGRAKANPDAARSLKVETGGAAATATPAAMNAIPAEGAE